MPSLADVMKGKIDALTRRMDGMTGVFEVATTSPFEVYLNGVEVAMPALEHPGSSYSVGTTGFYILVQGQLPLCIPTA